MTEYSFFKFSGAGNTFAVAWATLANKDIDKKSIIRIASPVNGFAVDGVLIITKHSERECTWNFYNSDGSTAEMCGNAARCVALFFKMSGLSKEVKLNTLSGAVFLNPESVSVEMRDRQLLYTSKKISINNEDIFGYYVDSGVPHFLIENENLGLECCQKIRNHSEFSPRGSNVTVYRRIDDDLFFAKTYERGVENFTLACGTGALALAGLVMNKESKVKIKIQMPGGSLIVEKLKTGYRLSGDTEYIGSFKISF